MDDKTRDALLLAVAEALLAGEIVGQVWLGSQMTETRRPYVDQKTEAKLRELVARAKGATDELIAVTEKAEC